MATPLFPKRKADMISNGVFLILLGSLFYTGQWWPGILFAVGLTFALRQYLTGRRWDFFVTLVLMGILGVLTLAGKAFSFLFPILLIGAGLYLVMKECLPPKSKDSFHSPDFKE